MSIITISRGSYSEGREVAERVAERLKYTSISREVILEAAKDFHTSERELFHAVHDAPSLFDRLTFEREKNLAHLLSAFYDTLNKDNVVYHGLAGHFFVRHVPHVLKVRIIADMEDRIRKKMQADSIPRKDAVNRLKRDDEERKEWSLKLYGVDTTDPSLYDMTLHIRKLTLDNAVDIICRTIQLEQFRTTQQSRKLMDDLALAAKVKAKIVEKYPKSEVTANGETVIIHARVSGSMEPKVMEDLQCLAREVGGVKDVKIHVTPITLFE
ncbi:MAG: cytidylate kinase-like family protein [Desulfoferrobacter sp.]